MVLVELSFAVDDPSASCPSAMMILVELSFDVDDPPSSYPSAMMVLVELSFDVDDPPSSCPPTMMIVRVQLVTRTASDIVVKHTPATQSSGSLLF